MLRVQQIYSINIKKYLLLYILISSQSIYIFKDMLDIVVLPFLIQSLRNSCI